MLDEITYPFQNFKGVAVEVWEWIGNFISHLTELVTYAGIEVKCAADI